MDNEMLQQALKYYEFGWSVLPVKPQEKRPFMTNWLQYQKERATKEMITNWFTSLTGAGIGIVTGKISNIVVLDVESWCEIPIEELLKKYPTSMVSKSGSGGYHLYFTYPQGVSKIRNRVGIFNGADLRADGGFVVAPKTLHPCGVKYEWYKEGPLGVFPKELLDLESEPENTSKESWITEILHGVSEGGRNDACARLTGYLLKKCLSIDIIEEILIDWNEKNNPPLPISEIRNTIQSISRSHTIQNNSQFTSVDFVDDRNQTNNTPNSVQNQNTFDVLGLNDYIRGYGGEGVSWLVQDWLPDKSITFLVSPPESYKTWILLDLAISVASGSPFLGQFQVNNIGPTLIIQQEDSHTGLTDRLALEMECKLGCNIKLDGDNWEVPSLPNIPIYVHPSRQLRFDNAKVIEELEKQIEIIKPKVILIDPLYSTTSSVDGYMADLANQMMVLKAWRDKYGCSFVIAHHSKKNVDPDSTAREDSWGSQFLNAFLEAGWQIRRNSKLAQNEIIVRRHSKVMGNQPPISVTFDISTVYPMKYDVVTRAYNSPTNNENTSNNNEEKPKSPRRKKNSLMSIIESESPTFNRLMEVTGKQKAQLEKELKQLENIGYLMKMPNGKYISNSIKDVELEED